MKVLSFALVLGIAFVIPQVLAAQSLERSFMLNDGDPLSPDKGFGVALDPDGVHAYATIAGELSFPGTAPNNDDVVSFDLFTGAQTAIGQTGLFPEDIAVLRDASGATRHLYVSNSTSGTVTCLLPNLQPIATIALSPCFGSVFQGSFPFGLLVSPDQTRLYVTTVGGCDVVEVLDVDPTSPTFNTRLSSFTVVGGGGRPSWWTWPLMVVPTSTYDPTFSFAIAGFTIVDVTNPSNQTPYAITQPIVNHYTAAYEAHVISGNRVLVTVGFEVFPTLYECSLTTGAVLRTLNLNTVTGIVLHGLGVNASETTAAVTSLNGGETVLVDLATFGVLSVYDHGSTARPNDAVFTQDGSRIVVSMQGRTRVDVLCHLPNYALSLTAPATVNQGAGLTLGVANCEFQSPWAIYVSLSGAGPIIAGPHTVLLTPPFDVLASGTGSVAGQASAGFTIPVAPGISGLPVYLQAVTVDRDGGVRLSNGRQFTIN